MLKLKALLLTQGMHGMISQVEGLAKALGLSFRHETVILKKFWNYIPPKVTPVIDGILEKKFICDSKIIISCGRKSVIPSILLKRRFKEKVFNIHIQDPKVNLENFDSIICPEHDNLEGKNVIKTKGAIHYLTTEEINRLLNKDQESIHLLQFVDVPDKWANLELEKKWIELRKIKDASNVSIEEKRSSKEIGLSLIHI